MSEYFNHSFKLTVEPDARDIEIDRLKMENARLTEVNHEMTDNYADCNHADLCKLYDQQYDTTQYYIKKNDKLRKALEFIGHECIHSEEFCPTREQMQNTAREALKE